MRHLLSDSLQLLISKIKKFLSLIVDKNQSDKILFFNERIIARYNRPNKNSSFLFEANRSNANEDILVYSDVVAGEYG